MGGILDLSKKIRQARILAGFSQKELARRIGVSDKTISAYELSRAIPPLTTLQKIAKTTKKPVEYFFEENRPGVDRIKIIEKQVKTILKEVKKLSARLEK